MSPVEMAFVRAWLLQEENGPVWCTRTAPAHVVTLHVAVPIVLTLGFDFPSPHSRSETHLAGGKDQRVAHVYHGSTRWRWKAHFHKLVTNALLYTGVVQIRSFDACRIYAAIFLDDKVDRYAACQFGVSL